MEFALREIKDRIYFFRPTRTSSGILVSYRDDVGCAQIGWDVEDIYKLKPADKDVLIRALVEQEPFAKLIECKRENKRVPVVFTRAFGDRNAIYCAIELKASFADARYVTRRLGFGALALSGCDEEAATPMDVDPKLYKYLNTIYCGNADPERAQRDFPDSPDMVADAIMMICEFIGVQLELDMTMDIWEHTESRFSFMRCALLAVVFGCIARKYTKKRMLSVELCRCFDNCRLKFALDFYSEDDERCAEAVLGEFSRIMDVAIAQERGESCVYEAIPMELDLEVIGVKEKDF